MLHTVTITGADDQTSLRSLLALARRYPFVEWGILFSGRTGRARFPSLAWVEDLTRFVFEHPMKLSAHLCGRYVKELVEFGDFTWRHRVPVPSVFQRVQINTHGEAYAMSHVFYDRIRRAAAYEGFRVILQIDGRHDEPFLATIRGERLDGGGVIEGLVDQSHGAGALPGSWRVARPRETLGYAGGLGPDSLPVELPKILSAALGAGVPTWVDMETQVRTNEVLDLDKVDTSLRLCEPYIYKESA